MIKYCPKCGEKRHNNSKYCSKCGFNFNEREKHYLENLRKAKLQIIFGVMFFIFTCSITYFYISQEKYNKSPEVTSPLKENIIHQTSSIIPPKISSNQNENENREDKSKSKFYEYYLIYYNVEKRKTDKRAQVWINERDKTIRIKIKAMFKHVDETIPYRRDGMRFYFEGGFLDIYLQPKFGINNLARVEHEKYGIHYFRWSRREIS